MPASKPTMIHSTPHFCEQTIGLEPKEKSKRPTDKPAWVNPSPRTKRLPPPPGRPKGTKPSLGLGLGLKGQPPPQLGRLQSRGSAGSSEQSRGSAGSSVLVSTKAGRSKTKVQARSARATSSGSTGSPQARRSPQAGSPHAGRAPHAGRPQAGRAPHAGRPQAGRVSEMLALSRRRSSVTSRRSSVAAKSSKRRASADSKEPAAGEEGDEPPPLQEVRANIDDAGFQNAMQLPSLNCVPNAAGFERCAEARIIAEELFRVIDQDRSCEITSDEYDRAVQVLSEAGVDDDVLLSYSSALISQDRLIGIDEPSIRTGDSITQEQWMERMEHLCCDQGALEFVTQGQHNLRSLRDAFDPEHYLVSAPPTCVLGYC